MNCGHQGLGCVHDSQRTGTVNEDLSFGVNDTLNKSMWISLLLQSQFGLQTE